MAPKTDTFAINRRSRVRTACRPVVESLLAIANHFPPGKEMYDLVTPFFSESLFKKFGMEESSKYKAKEEEYHKALYRSALEMLDSLEARGFLAAKAILAPPENWRELYRLMEELLSSNEAAFTLIEDAKAGKIAVDQRRVKEHIDKVAELRRKIDLRRAQFARAWIDKYYRIRVVKKLLERLAFIGRNFETQRRMKNAGFTGLNHLLSDLYVDEDGILHKEEDPVIEDLLGIDVRRIRQCSICQLLFWAGRIDRKCCGKKCADRYNQRLSRERKQMHGTLYREAEKAKRIRNPKQMDPAN